MDESLLQLIGLLLGIDAAFFISRGNLGLSAQTIASISSTNYGSNPHLLRSFAGQNADNCAGVFLLVIGIALQAAGVFVPTPIQGAHPLATALLVAVGVAILAFLVSLLWSNRRAQNISRQAQQIIDDRPRKSS